MDAPAQPARAHFSPTLDRDRQLSPLTGWTRASYLDLLDAQLAACAHYATDDGARILPPGPTGRPIRISDPMEGFARSFIGAAVRICADPSDPTGLIERYSRGLVAGCNPDHPGCWPRPTDRSQTIVEAAAIALGLTWTKQWLFDRLSPAEQRIVTDYLGHVAGKVTPNNNWHLFVVVVNEFCQQTTTPGTHEYRAREEEITARLDLLEQWYRGNGWYGDGPIIAYDHYCGWALHLYSVMWARAAIERRPDARRRLRTYRDRLRVFLEHYALTFADDGAPLHFGRSLIYRHAAVAPLWLGHLVDATGLAPGVTRGMSSRTLQYFLDHGAFSVDGLPNLGWHQPFLPMVQSYSGPASPLWSMKAFLGLLLPPDHPVWTDVERPTPWQGRNFVGPVGIDGVLATRSAAGLVRMANYGSNHSPRAGQSADPLYSRIGYSTHTGPLYPVAPQDRPDGLDQGLSIRRDGASSYRRFIHTRHLSSNRPCAAAVFRPLWPGVELDAGLVVLSASSFVGDEELRVHVIRSARAGDCAIDGGAAVGAGVAGSMPTDPAEPSALVRGRQLTGWSRGIAGWSQAITLPGVSAFDGGADGDGPEHLDGPDQVAVRAAASALRADLPGDDLTVLVSAHGLALSAEPPMPCHTGAHIQRTDDKVEITLGPLNDQDEVWHLLIPMESLDCSFEQVGYIP